MSAERNSLNLTDHDLELPCIKCGYDLRMLDEQRCPECGSSFEWDVVVAATERSVARGLFEYGWQRSPFRSFAKTLWLSLIPWRLWQGISLGLTPNFMPLLALIPLVVLVYSVLAFVRIQSWYWILREPSAGPFNIRAMPFWAPWNTFDIYCELVLPSLFAVFLFLLSQVFMQTKKRYNFGDAHILRIVVMSWIGILMLRSIIEIVCANFYAVMKQYFGVHISYPDYLMAMVSISFLLVSLGIAFSTHLSIRWGWAWAIVMFLSASVSVVVVLFACSGYYYRTITSWNSYDKMIHLWGKEWWDCVYW